jgi:putative membrane protein
MWDWRPEVLAPLGLMAIASGVGWWRLSERSRRAVPVWRPVLLAAGLAAVAAALLSPIAGAAHDRFSTHMIQHVLLVMLAPPLFMLADPLPAALWALPRSVRLATGRFLAPGALLRRFWRALTWPPAAWLVSALALWLWHLPGAYEAALRDDRLHGAEHLVLFGAGILGWWPLIGPSPRVRGHLGYSLRVVYLVLTGGQQALLGLLLSTSPVVLYGSYAAGAAARGVSPLDDQAAGGVIMWATSGVVGLVTLMVLMYRLLGQEERLPPIEGPQALPAATLPSRGTPTSFLPSAHD